LSSNASNSSSNLSADQTMKDKHIGTMIVFNF